MRYVIISDPNHAAGGTTDFRVHREGCRDVERHTKLPRFGLAGSTWPSEAATPEAAVAAEVEAFKSQDMSWGPDDFTILPCCRAEAPSRARVDTCDSADTTKGA
jgi:hypothetical protein